MMWACSLSEHIPDFPWHLLFITSIVCTRFVSFAVAGVGDPMTNESHPSHHPKIITSYTLAKTSNSIFIFIIRRLRGPMSRFLKVL